MGLVICGNCTKHYDMPKVKGTVTVACCENCGDEYQKWVEALLSGLVAGTGQKERS